MSLAPIPVHGALDNLAACRMAQRIIQSIGDHHDAPFPQLFELMVNGDLWKRFHRNMLARGQQTMKIVKVKGHDKLAEGESPTDGRLSDINGNSNSDALAKQARRDHSPPNLVRLGDYFAWRQQQYTSFVVALHAILVRMHLAAHRLRQQPAYRLQHQQASGRRPQLFSLRKLPHLPCVALNAMAGTGAKNSKPKVQEPKYPRPPWEMSY